VLAAAAASATGLLLWLTGSVITKLVSIDSCAGCDVYRGPLSSLVMTAWWAPTMTVALGCSRAFFCGVGLSFQVRWRWAHAWSLSP
jgi:hypothetical protein